MSADHIPEIVLERYRLRELPPAAAARIAERLTEDTQLRQRLAALDESDAALREPIERMRARLIARHPSPGRRTIAWAIPAAVTASIVLGAVLWQAWAPGASLPSEDRIKGNTASGRPALALYRRTADGSEQLAEGAVARAGDLIRVGYRAAGRPYGLIVSIDGAGAVTMHLPTAGDRAVALKGDPIVLLDQSYELDDAPRWERFYFVAGATAFDVGPVVRAARDAAKMQTERPLADLALPRGLEQAGFTLQKESRR
jgi:hypothetical protein